jgi:hypothetical protein
MVRSIDAPALDRSQRGHGRPSHVAEDSQNI